MTPEEKAARAKANSDRGHERARMRGTESCREKIRQQFGGDVRTIPCLHSLHRRTLGRCVQLGCTFAPIRGVWLRPKTTTMQTLIRQGTLARRAAGM